MEETKARSALKSILWRVIAVLNNFAASYAYLGKIGESITIAIIANIIGFALYYFYERIWNGIKWGKK